MEYVLFIFSFIGLVSVGLAVGVYMIYSGIKKDKGVVLPDRNYISFLHNIKKGDEWTLIIQGVAFSLVMLALLYSGVLALIEFVESPLLHW